MTVKQFRVKARVARESGSTVLDDGVVLYWTGEEFSLRDRYGNTVDTAYSPERLEYLYE